jgi:hypothetical protein
MATPKEALTGVSQTININSNAKAAPPNQGIGNTDSIIFQNNDQNSAATVTFLGAGASEFNYQGMNASTISVPAGASFGPMTPNFPNVTVDYKVSVDGNNGGPFSIEVGAGPLEIDITDAEGSTNLGVAEIPNNGTVYFNNKTNDTASITFSPANVLFDGNGNSVTQQTVNGNSAGAVLTGRGTNKNVSYWVNMSNQERDGRVGSGAGSIKVGSN